MTKTETTYHRSCVFSRGGLNARLSARIQTLLRGHICDDKRSRLSDFAGRRELLQRFYRNLRGFLPVLGIDLGGAKTEVFCFVEGCICDCTNGLSFLTVDGAENYYNVSMKIRE